MIGYTSPNFYQQFFDANGRPLGNGKLYTYQSNSTVPKNCYYDLARTLPTPNPIPLDASGVVPQYFFEDGLYAFVLHDKNDVYVPGSRRDDIQVLYTSGSTYTLSAATGSTLGGIKVGQGLTITSAGVLSVLTSGTSGTNPYLPLSGGTLTGRLSGTDISISGNVSANRFVTSSAQLIPMLSGSTGYAGDARGYFDNFGSSNSLKILGNGWDTNYDMPTGNAGLYFGVNDNAYIGTLGDNALHLGAKYYMFLEASSIYQTSGNLILGEQYDQDKFNAYQLVNTNLLNQKGKSWFSDDVIFYTSSINLYNRAKGVLLCDSNGEVFTSAIDGMVKYTDNDALQYPNKKLKAGAGITITSAYDVTNGIVLSINSRTNSWRPITNITSDYAVIDTDDTIVVQAAACVVTLPQPSVQYHGRVVTVQCSKTGSSSTIICPTGLINGLTPSVSNFGKLEFICVTDSYNYFWVCR